jgi:hypothetical protein
VVEQVLESTEVPLERLEAEICEGAAHLFAGMARWLRKVAEFDRRAGYERWDCRSTAFWLNWHCGISIRTAQEQVRVARALEQYPAVAASFCRGELSYSKVRAITRVATPATEAQLLEWAPHTTAAQLERIAAGQRRATRTEATENHAARHVSALWDDDGALVGTFRLDPDEGAALLAALTLGKDLLRAERSAERKAEKRSAERKAEKRSAERSADDCSPEPIRPGVSNADALALIVETMLGADRAKSISRHERTLVMIHVDAATAEAHLHDGPTLDPATARRMTCDAPVCAVFRKGLEVLDLGRTQRLPNRAQRRALMARDGGCRFPGCAERRYVEAHHVVHWVDGGRTDLDNLVLLCWRHHHAVHEGGYRMLFASGAVTVWRPDGTVLASEALPPSTGSEIPEQNHVLDLPISPDSLSAKWDGFPIDYPDAVEGLLWLEDRYRREVEATSEGLAS